MKTLLLLALFQQGNLEPDLAALLARVPPPRAGGPSVYNVLSADRIYAGDQLNVLTAAWLPRSLRLRLRQAPSLTPPVLSGVWATPRRPVTGAVASQTAQDEPYDLFVVGQTVYPLNPGALSVPPARISWVEPVRGRSGEMRSAAVSSAALTVQVRPLPSTGEPPGFGGPVGRDARVEYRLTGSGRAGAVVPVEVAVSGTGSLPLWPAPAISWPAGARAYDQGSDVSFGSRGSRLGGTRVFHYTVIPDSAGGLSLPPIDYPYFDPAASAYRVARAPAIVVPILESAPIAARRSPLPLLQPGRQSMARRIASLPGYVLWSLVVVPLLGIAAILMSRRVPRRARKPEPTAPPERLEQLVRALLPPGTGPSPHAITLALRQAGLAPEAAARLASLHLGIETLRYGGVPGRATPSGGLDREIDRELERIPSRIRRRAGIAALLALVLGAGAVSAQSGFELYNRGAYGAAAETFRPEARQFPSAARWYNVAAAEYLSGRDAKAAAALLTARGLAPRNPLARGLWNTLAREHGELRRVGRSWPFTAEESIAAAIVGAWLALILFVVAPRWPLLWVGSVFLALLGSATAAIEWAGQNVPRGVLSGGASQRISPHSLAPAVGNLPAFTVVELVRQEGGWWLVRSENREGWVPADILAIAGE